MHKRGSEPSNYLENCIHDKKILTITYQGELHLSKLVNTALEVRSKASNLGYRLLIDFTQITNKLSVSEGQSWIEKYLDPVNVSFKEIPTVYIVRESDYIFFKLMQFIWESKGIEIIMFKEIEHGIKWFESHA
ncbi:MAG: hypothetical protein ACFHWX_08965 [Bacteroidota bacterium]